MGRTIAFAMAVERLVPRHHVIKLLKEIAGNVRVRVFIDRHPGGRVGDINQGLSLRCTRIVDDLLKLGGKVDHLVAASGLDFQAMHVESIPLKGAQPQIVVIRMIHLGTYRWQTGRRAI